MQMVGDRKGVSFQWSTDTDVLHGRSRQLLGPYGMCNVIKDEKRHHM